MFHREYKLSSKYCISNFEFGNPILCLAFLVDAINQAKLE